MSMGSEDRGHSPLQVAPKGHFFRGRFGMDLGQNNVRLTIQRLNHPVGRPEWAIARFHEITTKNGEYRHPLPFSLDQEVVPTRADWIEISRPTNPFQLVDFFFKPTLIPDMVTKGNAVDPSPQDLLNQFCGDPRSGGGILCIRDHKVDSQLLTQTGQTILQPISTGSTHDISDE